MPPTSRDRRGSRAPTAFAHSAAAPVGPQPRTDRSRAAAWPSRRTAAARTPVALSHRRRPKPRGAADETRAIPQGCALRLPVIAVALTSCRSRSAAQLTVFDPVNYQENLLSRRARCSRSTTRCASCRPRRKCSPRMDQNLLRLEGTIHPGPAAHARRHPGPAAARATASRSACRRPERYERLFPRGLSHQPVPAMPGCARRSSAGRKNTPASSAPRCCKGRSAMASTSTAGCSGQAMDRSRMAGAWRWRRPATS